MYKHSNPRPGAQLKLPPGIPKEFYNYWRSKGRNPHNGARMRMTLEQCWSKWEPYWQDRHNGPSNLPPGDQYVLGRYGDSGDYTVENCRVVTHRENTLERDHKKVARPGTTHDRGNGNPRQAAPCWVGDTRYASIASAARAHGIHKTTAQNRIEKSGYPEWRYCEERTGPV